MYLRRVHLPPPRPQRESHIQIHIEPSSQTAERVVVLLRANTSTQKQRPFCPLWQREGEKKPFSPSHLQEDVWKNCGELED